MPPRPWLLLLLAPLALLQPPGARGEIAAHRVEALPGWAGPLPSRHWAGTLEITEPGDPNPKKLFYWFAGPFRAVRCSLERF
jgi:hypothetical protein